MRIASFSPSPLSEVNGNTVTLSRLQSALETRGHEMRIIPVETSTSPGDALDLAGNADLFHFYHAFRAGRLLPAFAGRPTVLSLSGTDVNRDLDDAVRGPVVRRALELARVIVTQSTSIASMIPRATLIPKGVTLGEEPFDLRSAARVGIDDLVYLLPGGLRPVKNPLLAVDALRPLLRSEPRLRLTLVGPLLDAAYGRRVQEAVAAESWVRYLPLVPQAAMAAVYRAANVVLNTSTSEGLSNSLLEAMACGRPIVASDIPGNRDLIDSGRTGLLFQGASGLEAAAASMLNDPSLRRRLGDAARADVSRRFSSDREAEAFLAACESTLRE